jgi:hypothetical protein
MKKVLCSIFLIVNFLHAYTEKDWQIYNACKQNVLEGHEYQDKEGDFYDYVPNKEYDYEACKEMLNHKDALKQYGAESSYKYWLKRLGK